MTDLTNTTSAREMTDGTLINHGGDVWTAYPEHEMCGSRVRWHSEAMVMSDRGMDGLLDDGATVVGRDDEAVAEWRRLTGR